MAQLDSLCATGIVAEMPKAATHQLTDMKVQEVSLVDVAANLRKWVLLKRAEMTDKAGDKKQEKADEPGVQKQEPISLPGQVKQNLTGTLADALEKLGALAEMVGGATVDNEAPVPPVVSELLMQCSALLSGAADQLVAPPPQAEPPPVPEAPPPAMPMEAAAKSGQEPGIDGVAKEAEGALKKAHGLIEKAGRKMAGRRLKELEKIVDGLVKLVRELGDTDGVKKAGEGNEPTLKAALDGLTARFDTLERTIKAELAQVAKSVSGEAAKAEALKAETDARVTAIGKALSTPAASAVGDPPQQSVKKARRAWPQDMSAALAKRNANARNQE